MIDSGLVGSRRGTTRAEHAQGTPTKSHIIILVYEDQSRDHGLGIGTPQYSCRVQGSGFRVQDLMIRVWC